ncbi:hypothetical protein GOP47_0013580 [Adiantum capillus-veneris]|uniref:SGNH hydrolase-type esterase domain-containing protein n=1 Tax=Adiantum capillus-veneris TaxID=13818 RepID=A0A9D4UNT0_ADICA|nr:hypothetical protein GOP47_0013580 [Adiantum capillus-veneris]
MAPYSPLLLLLLSALLPHPTLSIDLIVIGDSTASDYNDDPSTYPRAGWGMFLGSHFNPASGIVVRDAAAAGRSSKSFYDEKLWAQAKSKYLSPGDYVFIQFGHNDQKKDSHRHTDPFTSYKKYLTFYVKETRAAGGNPVLLTPISRAVWHKGTLEQTLGDYPTAMRQLAAQLRVPLLDMNTATSALFSKLGEKATQNNLFMFLPAGKYPNYPKGVTDKTHLQVAGAKQVAVIVAQAITKANLPIAAYVQSSDLV